MIWPFSQLGSHCIHLCIDPTEFWFYNQLNHRVLNSLSFTDTHFLVFQCSCLGRTSIASAVFGIEWKLWKIWKDLLILCRKAWKVSDLIQSWRKTTHCLLRRLDSANTVVGTFSLAALYLPAGLLLLQSLNSHGLWLCIGKWCAWLENRELTTVYHFSTSKDKLQFGDHSAFFNFRLTVTNNNFCIIHQLWKCCRRLTKLSFWTSPVWDVDTLRFRKPKT